MLASLMAHLDGVRHAVDRPAYGMPSTTATFADNDVVAGRRGQALNHLAVTGARSRITESALAHHGGPGFGQPWPTALQTMT